MSEYLVTVDSPDHSSTIDIYRESDGTYSLEVGNGCEDGEFLFPSLFALQKFVEVLDHLVEMEENRNEVLKIGTPVGMEDGRD